LSQSSSGDCKDKFAQVNATLAGMKTIKIVISVAGEAGCGQYSPVAGKTGHRRTEGIYVGD